MRLERASYFLIWLCIPFAAIGTFGLLFLLIFPVLTIAELFRPPISSSPLEITGIVVRMIGLTAVAVALMSGIIWLGCWLTTRVEASITNKTSLPPRVWWVSLAYNASLYPCWALFRFSIYWYSSPYSFQDALEDNWPLAVIPVSQTVIAGLGLWQANISSRRAAR